MVDQQGDELVSALKRFVASTIESAERRGAGLEQLPIQSLEVGRPAVLDNSRYLDWAREIYEIRRMRSKHFPEIFGEPAWDLILDLYIAFLEGRKVTTKSACIGADCPASTALRWIIDMEAAGLIYRVDDASDRRRKWIGLAKETIWAMNHLCDDALGAKRRARK